MTRYYFCISINRNHTECDIFYTKEIICVKYLSVTKTEQFWKKKKKHNLETNKVRDIHVLLYSTALSVSKLMMLLFDTLWDTILLKLWRIFIRIYILRICFPFKIQMYRSNYIFNTRLTIVSGLLIVNTSIKQSYFAMFVYCVWIANAIIV